MRLGVVVALAFALALGAAASRGRAAPAVPAPAAAQGPFSDWAGFIVAGDWRAHSGKPSEVFDNARRDLAKAFVRAGFAPQNLIQFSVRPERYRDTRPLSSAPRTVAEQMVELTGRVRGGCLVYFTSHGSPEGVAINNGLLTPAGVARLVDETCGERPTVVVMSACFSGVFVEPLARPDRMVLTAARADRASFGCGEQDRYTFFDACVLQELPRSSSFADLGPAVQACVAKREHDLHAAPASEPQVYLGPELRPLLPLLAFAKPPPEPPAAQKHASAATN